MNEVVQILRQLSPDDMARLDYRISDDRLASFWANNRQNSQIQHAGDRYEILVSWSYYAPFKELEEAIEDDPGG